MAKVLGAIVIGVIVLLGVTQLVIPGFVERDIEGNFEDRSGSAETRVDVKAFPAVRLLWGSGDRIEVRGRGQRVDLAETDDDPLAKVEGFDEVDIELTDVFAGPINVQQFSLVRTEDDEAFKLEFLAETTPLAVAESVGGEFGGELGRLIASAATSALPDGGETDVVLDVDGLVTRPDGGGIEVGEATASVASLPAGPFAEAMVRAVLARL
jgi:hypothetical protein